MTRSGELLLATTQGFEPSPMPLSPFLGLFGGATCETSHFYSHPITTTVFDGRDTGTIGSPPMPLSLQLFWELSSTF